ncbi:MAG: hypothetical protein JWM74_1440 [Myxococcaceae bacterium]|nr:hypothetical protein [Myxococcaceae bacterium]
MARSTRRCAATLLLLGAPSVALFPACGGADTVPFDEARATAADSALSDRSTDETSLTDTSTSESSSNDGSSTTDTSVTDARDGGDARLPRAADPRIGSLVNFAVFAGSTATNAFATPTTITGDLGTYPSTTAIGATPPVLIGEYHLGDTIAATAATDIATAYNNLMPAAMPGCTSLTGQDLGGQTLAPGIYCFSTSAQLTGALVLDAGGNPNAEWFFQIGSALTTGPLGAAPASVTVVGASPCRVYWQIGSSATLGTGTTFSGNILASSSITLVTGTKIEGRALAFNGAVSMDTNTVSISACP